ncbi:amino acid ABC transporter permease [Frigidibacter sp. MR17.14]|uniref:amino acid ABC transporter permease n=1 Tax=Frigidibacter sp. MR17.14 TaxID=3126509 RepID=UPI003012B6EE
MSFDPQILAAYLPELWKGLRVTLWLFLAIMGLCTPIALAIALARISGRPWLAWAAATYVNVIRSIPLLVILFFTFYGLPVAGIYVSPFTAAMIGLTVCTSAYLAEDLRAGLMAIPRGQYEAAAAMGLPPGRFVARVLIPQALPVMCAPYFTRAIVSLKATSIASMVAVGELTSESMAALTETYRAAEFLGFAAVSYLVISSLLALLQAAVQRAVRLP